MNVNLCSVNMNMPTTELSCKSCKIIKISRHKQVSVYAIDCSVFASVSRQPSSGTPAPATAHNSSPSTQVGVVWSGLVWSGLVWSGLAWPGLAWPGLAWPGLAWPGLAWSRRFTLYFPGRLVQSSPQFLWEASSAKISIIVYSHVLIHKAEWTGAM